MVIVAVDLSMINLEAVRQILGLLGLIVIGCGAIIALQRY